MLTLICVKVTQKIDKIRQRTAQDVFSRISKTIPL